MRMTTLSAIILTYSISAHGYWSICTQHADYYAFEQWNNNNCTLHSDYRERRPGNAAWYWRHGFVSPCDNQPDWYWQQAYTFPSGFESLTPLNVPYEAVSDSGAGWSVDRLGTRTFALWDGDDGFNNMDLYAAGAHGTVYAHIDWSAYALTANGPTSLLASGTTYNVIDFASTNMQSFAIDSDFDGWSNSLQMYPSSATGYNNGDVMIFWQVYAYAEDVDFP